MRACDGTKRAIVVSRFLASLTLTRPNGLVLTRAARRRVQHLLGVAFYRKSRSGIPRPARIAVRASSMRRRKSG